MPADDRKLYLTPAAYRAPDRGVAGLAGMSDETVREVLALASSLCDAECSVDLGIAQTRERHPWLQASRRVFPNVTPILSVEDFKVYVSTTQYGTIHPNDIFIASGYGMIEIVSLAAVAYSLVPAIVNLAMSTPFADFLYTHGHGLTVAEETLVFDSNAAEDSGIWTASWHSAHALWGPDYPVTLLIDDVATTDFEVDYVLGKILLTRNVDPTAFVLKASYGYATPPQGLKQAVALTVTYWLEEQRLLLEGLGLLGSATIGSYQVSRKAPNYRSDTSDLVLPGPAVKLLRSFQKITLH